MFLSEESCFRTVKVMLVFGLIRKQSLILNLIMDHQCMCRSSLSTIQYLGIVDTTHILLIALFDLFCIYIFQFIENRNRSKIYFTFLTHKKFYIPFSLCFEENIFYCSFKRSWFIFFKNLPISNNYLFEKIN